VLTDIITNEELLVLLNEIINDEAEIQNLLESGERNTYVVLYCVDKERLLIYHCLNKTVKYMIILHSGLYCRKSACLSSVPLFSLTVV